MTDLHAAFELIDNKQVFRAGRDDVNAARQQAAHCGFFAEDDEDEQVDDELHSCYNCVYRRWLTNSFHCTKFE